MTDDPGKKQKEIEKLYDFDAQLGLVELQISRHKWELAILRRERRNLRKALLRAEKRIEKKKE